MDEDLELNRLLKSSLEARPPFAWHRPGVLRRRVSWAVATLLAASVALVALFPAQVPSQQSSVEDALRLLSTFENVDLGSGGAKTPAELLLAWQETGI